MNYSSILPYSESAILKSLSFYTTIITDVSDLNFMSSNMFIIIHFCKVYKISSYAFSLLVVYLGQIRILKK